MMPKRIQRKRTKGWRMPPNTVYVGRPSKWGNPFTLRRRSGRGIEAFERQRAVDFFALDRFGPLTCRADLEELRGKDLACWCRLDQLCHADVLLKAANK